MKPVLISTKAFGLICALFGITNWIWAQVGFEPQEIALGLALVGLYECMGRLENMHKGLHKEP